MRMSEKTITEKIDYICETIEYSNDFGKRNAIEKFKTHLMGDELDSSHIDKFLKIIEPIFDNPSETIHLDTYEALCIIGKKNFTFIKSYFGKISEYLKSKNKLYLKSFLSLLNTYSTSKNPIFVELIQEIFKNPQLYF